MLLFGCGEDRLLPMVSHQFGLVESKSWDFLQACGLRHTCPFPEGALLGHVIDALHLLKVHDCAEIEACPGLVHEIVTSWSTRSFEVCTLSEAAHDAILEFDRAVHGTTGCLEVDSAPHRVRSASLWD